MSKKNLLKGKQQKVVGNSVTLSEELQKMKLLTLDTIYTEYPKVKDKLGWSKEDIQVFFESHILLGKYEPEDSTDIKDLLIESDSLEKLIEYHKELSN